MYILKKKYPTYLHKNSLSPQQEIQKDRQKHRNVRNISENHRTIPFEYGFLFMKRNLQMKFKCPDTGTVRKLDDILYAKENKVRHVSG